MAFPLKPWLKRWKKERKAKVVPLCLPPEIWLHIISYLPHLDEWAKTKLYRVNRTFLDYYISQRYRDIQLFNPVPGLDGFTRTQLRDEHLTRRNLAVLRNPHRSKVVRTLRIRFKVQYFDYRREAAEPENLEMALRGYLELLREGQSIPALPSLGDTPRIYLPALNKLTLDLNKAIGFRADPAKLLDKSLRAHVHPFLVAHANLITTFSFSTPQDNSQIGDACFLNLPHFPSLEALSLRVFLDPMSKWNGASRFLEHHSTKLKQLKVTFSPLLITERARQDNPAASTPPKQVWTRQLFWATSMPALTEFQLWSKIPPVEGEPSLDLQLPQSTILLERLILPKPLAIPGDLKKLIRHLEGSGSATQLKELFIPKAELDHLALNILARGLPRLRRLSVHSINLKSLIDTSEVSAANATHPCSEWGLERLDFLHSPISEGDSDRYRRTLAAILPKVPVFRGMDRNQWLDVQS